MIGADHATLQDAPEAFNRVGVKRAHNVVAALADDPVRQIAAKQAITGMFVRAEQTDLVRRELMNEAIKRPRVRAVDYPQHHVAFAADGTDHGRFAGAMPSEPPSRLALCLFAALPPT